MILTAKRLIARRSEQAVRAAKRVLRIEGVDRRDREALLTVAVWPRQCR
jgi:hypothetical protein